MMTIDRSTLSFLKAIAKNNDRPWFEKNKSRYETARSNMDSFCQEQLDLLKKHDLIDTATGRKAVYRIYRDVRFSKDKKPYKEHLAAYFRRSTKELRGGYYLAIQPGGQSRIGGGFWGPAKEDLQLIRSQIDMDAEPLRNALKNKKIVSTFGALQGEELKSAPRGYAKDHPEIDLLRYKQFLLSRTYTDEEVLSPTFSEEVAKGFRTLRPFFDAMSLYLTTDLNGEPL